jgi:hypothetical protein
VSDTSNPLSRAVTSRGKEKVWSWSYSKLKNFETCPKRHYNVDVAKTYAEDEESGALAEGNAVHKVLDTAIGKGVPLPQGREYLQKWVDRMRAPGAEKIMTEQKFAITEGLAPTEYFGPEAWYRGQADVIRLNGPVALAVDWKTGKILEDGVQLALMAQCIFSHYQQVQKIRTVFVWLKEDADTRLDITRSDMVRIWADVLPRVARLKAAYDANEFVPRPGYLCRKYCPVVACPHHGI